MLGVFRAKGKGLDTRLPPSVKRLERAKCGASCSPLASHRRVRGWQACTLSVNTNPVTSGPTSKRKHSTPARDEHARPRTKSWYPQREIKN